MKKFGFKFFSTNFLLAPATVIECAEFAATNPDTFLEITATHSTSEADLRQIKQQIGNIEVRIHASYEGVDTGNRELEQHNKQVLSLAQKAADIFNSPTIIVHAGYGHGEKYLAETARQFKLFHDERIVVENLPYFDNLGNDLHGTTATEISYIMSESGCGFCFDFSHAICAAISRNIDVEQQLNSLYALHPAVYHLCDGDLNTAKDMHLHFGNGNFPLKHYLRDYTDENAHITIETGKGFERQNDLRIKDYAYLKLLDK